MYPSITDFSRPNAPSEASSSQTQASYGGQGRWPPSQLPAPAQNGPSSFANPTPLVSAPSNAQNFPTLRVQIAEQFRTFPPVMLNPGLEEIPRSTFSFDFAFEHDLVRRLQDTANSQTAAPQRDPSRPDYERIGQLGFSREEVSLALAAVGSTDEPQDAEVVEFCRNFKELKSMGFDSASVTGALILHKKDLQAATDACLAAQN